MKITKQTLGQGSNAVRITLYQPDDIADFQTAQTRPLAIILPGGGFEFYSQRETEPIALAYLAQGFSAVVVDYRLLSTPPVLPTALWQIGTVVQHFRHHAADYQVAPDRFVLNGFSAGGYLAAVYAGLWAGDDIAYQLSCASHDLRVNALVLAYPVIGLRLGWPTDQKTWQKLTQGWPAHEADQLVTGQNPPTFIWATQTDELVPVTNTLTYVQALNRAGVPVQSRLYDHGPHGLGLAQAMTAFPQSFKPQDPQFGDAYVQPDVAEWFPEMLAWLKRRWHLTAFWHDQ
ncbi:alpha/beta hydrolase [Levilactobacillus acidifarinae]|uniref:BD-FAE-like domain-containing protein n=1 Tax=Levilactobacillus acidifarinae DSM 19394 = JCM 15949 TaxID=1423715 RepID=A0A0R1LVY6_9LACO|nr:alpha/beta hydrolase [Levilactobacillus acidifarinae]KRK95815.1 hypothetical protein FD25_GL002271 [Levilactobacillus acidifarinae DSM 19394]GEO69114.1 lipase [Levilactobacillus acidifarinae]